MARIEKEAARRAQEDDDVGDSMEGGQAEEVLPTVEIKPAEKPVADIEQHVEVKPAEEIVP